MGMVTCFALLSDANIARVLADPPLIWQVVALDDPEMYEQARKESNKPRSLLSRLFDRSGPSSEAAAPIALAGSEGEAPDLDKAWHGIHFLLTGTADDGDPPLNFLVAGGRTVGAIDVGYGPARVYTSVDTRQIAAALTGVTDAEARSRYNSDRMKRAEVYPDIWGRIEGGQDEGLEYLMENLQTLRNVLQTAVEANLGFVVYLS